MSSAAVRSVVIHCLLLLPSFMDFLCLMQCLVVFLSFCNYLAEEKRAGCFIFIVFLLSCGGLFLTALWVGLSSVIVAFPGHTYLPFDRTLSSYKI